MQLHMRESETTTPLPRAFPVRGYAKVYLGERKRPPGTAPLSFASMKLDTAWPALTWPTLRQIWLRDLKICPTCHGALTLYGFTADASRGHIARACLSCETRHIEHMSYDRLRACLMAWGFGNAEVCRHG